MTTPLLEVRDLHKSYGKVNALNGVTFDVAPGEVFGLLGPNGAGKTTLLSIVSCLLAADRGEARLGGQPLTPANRAVRPLLGIVPQEVRRLNSGGMTIVYTSHYMEEVQTLCPRIGIMDQGRLIACDTLPNLLLKLRGLVRFRVHALSPALRTRLKEMRDLELIEPDV